MNKLLKMRNMILMTVLFGVVSLGFTANSMATDPPAEGMVVWFEADAGVLQDPNGVTVWQDQSGNSNHANRILGAPQLATATFPNGTHDVLRFNGSDALRLTDVLATQLTDFNIFIVANYDVGAVNERFFSNYSVGTMGTQYGYSLGTNGSGNPLWWYFGSTELTTGTYLSEKNYLTIYTLENSQEKKLYVLDEDDGQTAYTTAIGSAPIQYTSDPGLPAHNCDIGAIWIEWEGYGWFGGHTGDIAEILVYDLTDPDFIALGDPNVAFDDVRTYINEKYGMNIYVDDSPCPDPNTYDPNNPNYVWDFAVDFSPSRIGAQDAENPHHNWSYGYGAEGDLSDFQLYTNYYTGAENNGNPAWGDNVNGPVLWKAMSNPGWGIGLCEVGSHPGQTSSSKIRWTSPFEDVVAVTGMYGAGNGGPGDLWIVKDGSEILWYREETGAVDEPFDLRIPVISGTTIDFVHGLGDSWGGENKPVSIQITRGTLRCQDLGDYYASDINQDCYINLEDFAIIAQDWLKCNDPLDPACTDVP